MLLFAGCEVSDCGRRPVATARLVRMSRGEDEMAKIRQLRKGICVFLFGLNRRQGEVRLIAFSIGLRVSVVLAG